MPGHSPQKFSRHRHPCGNLWSTGNQTFQGTTLGCQRHLGGPSRHLCTQVFRWLDNSFQRVFRLDCSLDYGTAAERTDGHERNDRNQSNKCADPQFANPTQRTISFLVGGEFRQDPGQNPPRVDAADSGLSHPGKSLRRSEQGDEGPATSGHGLFGAKIPILPIGRNLRCRSGKAIFERTAEDTLKLFHGLWSKRRR